MSLGPMADYPHASAACLCYLDEREGGEEGKSKDTGRLMFSLFFCYPAGLSTLSCWPFEIGKRKKEDEGRRGERVSGPKSCSLGAGLLPDTSKRCLE